MGTFFIILGAFFLYKIIADFIIPIYRASKQVQAQFRNMQQNGQSQRQPDYEPRAEQKSKPSKSSDYIDFEEIKD